MLQTVKPDSKVVKTVKAVGHAVVDGAKKVASWYNFLAPHGIGVTGQGEAGVGAIYPGSAVTSGTAMVYYNDNGAGNKLQTGVTGSAGYAFTVGGFAGVGGALTLTNARSNNDQRGLSVFGAVNGGWGPAKLSIQLAVSPSGIWNLTVGPPVVGASAGANVDLGFQITKVSNSNAPTTPIP